MNVRKMRSIGLFVALATAAAAPFVACAAPEEDEGELSEDAVTGVNNPLGLALKYDAETGTVLATLKDSLRAGEQLRIRVRRGNRTLTSQRDLRCDDINEARPLTGEGSRTVFGQVVYRGPRVSNELLALMSVYDDHRWQSDPEWAAQRTEELRRAGGSKAIVEACIMRGSAVRAKLQTGLEYAWDLGEKDAKLTKSLGSRNIHLMAPDASAPNGQEEAIRSMEAYAQKCVDELGEIPFFKKLAPGKYDTFDCRDFVGTGEGHAPARMPGVEGALIPLTANDQPVTKCDGDGPNGRKNGSSYNCVSKCDKAEFLSEGCEPGPTVTYAKNDQGTHWTLLCRKVAKGENVGWLKTKVFDDIAMIGHDPRTGKTCFFQNNIGSGNDGEHVAHPADVEKSGTIWDSPKGYCFQSCHGTDPFIQTPWINGARKSNNNPVVPMMGLEPGLAISDLESPYYVINMDAQGWNIPKQLVSDEAGPCITCHRAGGDAWIRQFANWTTGAGENGGAMSDGYWNKITDSYKRFEKSHWMPMRLDGLDEQSWPQSPFAAALKHMNTCNTNRNDPSCVWADVPRGAGNPAAPGN